MWTEIIRSVLTVFGGILVSLFTYNFIEVRKKRKIETYWKIDAEYRSADQQIARKSIEEVEHSFKNKAGSSFPDILSTRPDLFNELVDYYNTEFHYSPHTEKREMAWKIRTRIRFLHMSGVLLRKKMIDKDLLFSLTGLGFEIDYPTMVVILAAHRKSHHTPSLYNHFEYLWKEYLKWKKEQPVIV